MLLLKITSSTSYPSLLITDLPYNPDLHHLNPVPYVVQSSGIGTVIKPKNCTFISLYSLLLST